MKKIILIFIIQVIFGNVFAIKNNSASNKDQLFTISKEALKDKSKEPGLLKHSVTFGVPVEFKYNSTMIQDYQSLAWNDSLLLVEFRDRPAPTTIYTWTYRL